MHKFQTKHLVILAVASSLLFWFADAFVDAVVFESGSISGRLLNPSPREMWVRSMFVLFVAGFAMLMGMISRQRERVEQKLLSSVEETAAERAKSEAIIAAIGDGISIQGPNFDVLYQNHVHESLVGGNFTGQKCYSAFAALDSPCSECPVNASFRDGGTHRLIKKAQTDSKISHIEIIAAYSG
jgi:hypothetical protein